MSAGAAPDAGRAPRAEDILSGRTGHVGPRRRIPLRAADRGLDLWLRARGTGRRLERLVRKLPRRRVLVVSVYRPQSVTPMVDIAIELDLSRHDVEARFGCTGPAVDTLAPWNAAERLDGGKFQNLNVLLRDVRIGDYDWLVVLDDDVTLPNPFIDRFLAICEAFGFALAQPAQTLASHAAWRVTRRRPGALARETRFVEIGPVTAIAREAARELVPFPDLRFGWGLDLHWSAIGRERDWRLGIVDALPVRHETGGVASAYPHEQAVEEARRFLAGRPYLRAAEVERTLVVHR